MHRHASGGNARVQPLKIVVTVPSGVEARWIQAANEANLDMPAFVIKTINDALGLGLPDVEVSA